MKKFVAMSLVLSLLLSGCATMFHGTTETIHVRSEEPNTKFYLNARELGTGTSAVTVVPKRELSTSVLRAEKSACNSKTSPIATKFDATSLLGVFLDYGIFSILIVDMMATGAVTQAAQKDYILTPDCSATLVSKAD